MKKNVVLVVALSTLLLSACTTRYASNGEHAYLKSENGPDIAVPAPMIASNMNHFYDLPPLGKNAEISIMPPSHLEG